MTKDKRKPPSRIKYEQTHPVISCRVPREIYDRLQDVKQRDGRSFMDILKIGLRIRESKAKKEDQAYSEGYERDTTRLSESSRLPTPAPCAKRLYR